MIENDDIILGEFTFPQCHKSLTYCRLLIQNLMEDKLKSNLLLHNCFDQPCCWKRGSVSALSVRNTDMKNKGYVTVSNLILITNLILIINHTN